MKNHFMIKLTSWWPCPPPPKKKAKVFYRVNNTSQWIPWLFLQFMSLYSSFNFYAPSLMSFLQVLCFLSYHLPKLDFCLHCSPTTLPEQIPTLFHIRGSLFLWILEDLTYSFSVGRVTLYFNWLFICLLPSLDYQQFPWELGQGNSP